MAAEIEYFVQYETTTNDPGWALTIIVVVVCLLMNLTLPLWVRLGRSWEAKRSREGASSNTTGEGDFPSEQSETAKGKLTAKDVLNTSNSTADESNSPEKGARRARPIYSPTRNSTRSLVSESYSTARSTTSSAYMRQIASLVLDARPKRKAHYQHQNHLHQHRPGGRRTGNHGKDRQNLPTETSDELGATDTDDYSVCKSVMSKLDQDAVSAHDAIDAQEGSLSQKMSVEKDSGWQKVIDVADCDTEMKKIGSLAVPYSIQGIVEGVYHIVVVAIIGHFLGVTEANAYVVVTILVEFTATLTYGFSEAIGTLGPQADGAGNDLLVGRYMQLGIIFFVLGSIPGAIIWSFWAEDAILWFGFDEETARLGQGYAYPFLAMSLFEGLSDCVHQLLDIVGHEKYSTVVQIVHYCILLLGLVVMTAMGFTDLVLIGIVQAFATFLMVVINFAFVMHKGWMDDYWEGLALTFSLRDGRSVHTMMITAIPLGIAWLLTYGEWEVMTLFASFMGPAEVAAWGMIGFVWDTFEQITSGLASAAEVRVGFRMGTGQPHTAKLVAYKSIYLGLVIAIFSTAGLFIIAEYLPMWLTPDPTLQRMIFEVLPLIGFGQILMIVGTVCWTIIAAQGRVRLATTVEFVSSWLIVLPLSALFIFGFNYNLLGLVAALVLGYSCGGMANAYLILRSNWKVLSDRVIAQHATEGTTYEQHAWDDLPSHIREAANVLGFTEKMWDTEKEPELSEKDWIELSHSEQDAARILGYNRRKWDGDDCTRDDPDPHTRQDFNNLDWVELPYAIQEAAKSLGFTKELWDNDEEPVECDLHWKKLSPIQQGAARKLGYNQTKWDSESDSESGRESDSESDSEMRKSSSKPTILHPIMTEVSYDDFDWDELPAGVRKAARILGFTEELWDNDKEPVECDLYWNELRKVQQGAARTLGYDQAKWDSGSNTVSLASVNRMLSFDGASLSEEAAGADPNPVVRATKLLSGQGMSLSSEKKKDNAHDDDGDAVSFSVRSVLFDDYAWDELPADVQKAAYALGYNKKSWDSDIPPSSAVKSWQQLGSAEQKAARQLGYSREKWNDKDDTKEDPQSTQDYDDYSWEELPHDIQKAAKMLGYSKVVWDTDSTPPSDDKDWHELTSVEQGAASKLGYDKEKWNDGSGPDV